MPIGMVLLPVFVQVALTFVIGLWMGASRVGTLRTRKLKPADIALGQPGWPEKTTKISNAYHNQLELPLLFYILVAFGLLTAKADLVFAVMSWLFVGSRIVHAVIHTGSNMLQRRFYAFAFGFVVLVTMWIIFAFRILTS